MTSFVPACLPMLIGSLPHSDHGEAVREVICHTPQLPVWPQLPVHRNESMILQYLEGFPGVMEKDDKLYVDSSNEEFELAMLSFYEEYLAVTEGLQPLEESRFILDRNTAAGLFALLEEAGKLGSDLLALKGQTTGPVTFATTLVDENGRAIYYNEQLRDIAIKLLALKSAWQVREMARYCSHPILFFDEPGLSGLGTSAFITLTSEEIIENLREVYGAVKNEGGLTGVHVCANTEWPVIFGSGVDIVSFDAFSFFDRLVLFKDELVAFFERGGILASGIVPTTAEHLSAVTEDLLVAQWYEQRDQLEAIGIDGQKIFAQTLITPSCGAGTLSSAEATKVMDLTAGVSKRIRAENAG